MRHMRQPRLAFATVLTLFALGIANAEAATIGFSGLYAPANWTIVVDHGAVDTAGAPAYVDIIGGSICTSGADPACRFTRQQFLFTAFEEAVISFDWDYRTFDMDGPFYDPFVWFGGGQSGGSSAFIPGAGLCQFLFPGNEQQCHQPGSGTFLVQPGDVFGFNADSSDSAHGPAITRLSNFSATPVPEPTTLVLIGTGLAAGAMRRRRMLAARGHRRPLTVWDISHGSTSSD